MDVVKLRTLSRKSTLGFGQYADINIQQILNIEKKAYLRWVYYNIEGISFLPDILEEISIKDTYLINKPGKNLEKHKELKFNILRYRYDKFGADVIYRQRSHNRKRIKTNLISSNKMRKKTYFKKSVLRSANQK